MWLLLPLAACSTLPEAGYPPFAEHRVVAEFVVGAAGLLPVPASHRALVVHELGAAPAPIGEWFGPCVPLSPGDRAVRRVPGGSGRWAEDYRGVAVAEPTSCAP